MQQYKYEAIDINKEKFEGKFIAKDEQDLANKLSKQGLFLVSCKPYKDETPSAFFTLGTGKITVPELTRFSRQFSIMINAGIPILECLNIIRNQSFSAYLKTILNMVFDDVKAGMMFSAALEKHKTVFPMFFRSMVRVGETSGQLDKVFENLADYYERDAAMKKKAKAAFSYPLMLLCMTVGITILMLVFIVPTFRESLSSLEINPEGITLMVYNISDFLLANWLYMLAGAVVIALIFVGIGKTEKGKYFYDMMKFQLPVIRNITMDSIASRFARSFALLLSSGMNVAEAMDTIVIVFGNKYVEDKFKQATEEVRTGMSMSEAFDKYKIFPNILTQMVYIGEKTATVDEILLKSCNFFDDQVDTTIASITSKIQPAMLMIMGVVIGGLFIAIYSPMISIMSSL